MAGSRQNLPINRVSPQETRNPNSPHQYFQICSCQISGPQRASFLSSRIGLSQPSRKQAQKSQLSPLTLLKFFMLSSPIFAFAAPSFFAVILAFIAFVASIFVHELGHFLAAKKAGLRIDRFSMGFGPKLISWTHDGVEYRISLIPFGGYVALPQLADLGAIEGGEKPHDSLPRISYASKVFVAVAGAFFNLVFAFVIASVLWFAGVPKPVDTLTKKIGFILPQVQLASGESVPSPASTADLKVGDEILAVDGSTAASWMEIKQLIVTGRGRDNEARSVTLLIRRGDVMKQIKLTPIVGADSTRAIGISPEVQLVIAKLEDNSAASRAGLMPGDKIVELNGNPVESIQELVTHIATASVDGVTLSVQRGDRLLDLTFERADKLGFSLARPWTLTHSDPVSLLSLQLRMTVRVLGALVSSHSDFSIRHVSGPPGMAFALYDTALMDTRILLWLLVLVNLNLAVFNLLPLPVLDGGLVLFATIAELRGKDLPRKFVQISQAIFFALLFGLIIYLSVNDIGRRFLE